MREWRFLKLVAATPYFHRSRRHLTDPSGDATPMIRVMPLFVNGVSATGSRDPYGHTDQLVGVNELN